MHSCQTTDCTEDFNKKMQINVLKTDVRSGFCFLPASGPIRLSALPVNCYLVVNATHVLLQFSVVPMETAQHQCKLLFSIIYLSYSVFIFALQRFLTSCYHLTSSVFARVCVCLGLIYSAKHIVLSGLYEKCSANKVTDIFCYVLFIYIFFNLILFLIHQCRTSLLSSDPPAV